MTDTISKAQLDGWETQIFECGTLLTNYVAGQSLPPDHPVEVARQKLFLLFAEVEQVGIAMKTAAGEEVEKIMRGETVEIEDEQASINIEKETQA